MRLFVCGLLVTIAAVSARSENPPALDRLAGWMTGYFTSETQAAADTNFFDIRLHMARIWPERTEAAWFYVEQAAAVRLEKPYRQRIYRVWQPNDSTFQSDVYTVAEPLRYAGAWQKPDLLAALTPDSLQLREGCSITLRAEGDSAFVGGTTGIGCASDLRGAAYAVSEVRITAHGMVTWDRSYDSTGTQVWGATTGGYHFVRVNEPATPATKEQPHE